MLVILNRVIVFAVVTAVGIGVPLPFSIFAKEGSPASGQHILWKVRSPHTTAYVLGSIHVLQAQHYPLAPEIYESFEQSSRIMFEVDLEGLSSPTAQLNMLQKGLLAPEQTLQSTLSSESFAIAKRDMAELGMDIQSFQRMKPWMAATALTALELEKLGFESAFGVDRHFFQKAQEVGKPVIGLETVEFQLGLLDNLSPSMQEHFLLQSLTDLKNLQSHIQDLVEAWRSGDLKKLEGLLDSMREFPELYEALVLRRNRDWVTKIDSALQHHESVFIVVGTLHLLGENGLVSLLEQKGYHVTQL